MYELIHSQVTIATIYCTTTVTSASAYSTEITASVAFPNNVEPWELMWCCCCDCIVKWEGKLYAPGQMKGKSHKEE